MPKVFITNRPAASVAEASFAVINGLQTLHPADQLIGLAHVLNVMSEALGTSSAELSQIAKRMERDCKFRQVNTLSAVNQYIHNEIARKFP